MHSWTSPAPEGRPKCTLRRRDAPPRTIIIPDISQSGTSRVLLGLFEIRLGFEPHKRGDGRMNSGRRWVSGFALRSVCGWRVSSAVPSRHPCIHHLSRILLSPSSVWATSFEPRETFDRPPGDLPRTVSVKLQVALRSWQVWRSRVR